MTETPTLEAEPTGWQRVGTMVKRRRRHLRDPSYERMAGDSDVSSRTWQNLIKGEGVSRTETKARIEEYLGWAPGSIDEVKDGGEPTIDRPADAEDAVKLVLEEVRSMRTELAELRAEVRDLRQQIKER